MDTPTLLANLERIVDEPSPITEQLDHLTPSEAHLYQALREDRYGSAVRLEQERITLDLHLIVNERRCGQPRRVEEVPLQLRERQVGV